MSSVSELEYYCKTDDPVGALLLTGEWGSGKTYYIENELPKKLGNNYEVVRISLFGIPTVEELHKAVKRSWFHAKGGLLDKASGLEKYKNLIEKVSALIPNKIAKGTIGAAISISLFDLIKIKNVINGKKVILVFDDLERSELSIQEKLGSINEYCENQHFNVIIVADEKRLRDKKEYLDFKEKIVQKTIYYQPCYSSIVNSVISEVNNESYKSLLQQHVMDITALFAGQNLDGPSLDNHIPAYQESYRRLYEEEGVDEEAKRKELLKSRPHNIRSLKTSIKDFERVFEILQDKKVEDCHRWLYAFVAFAMASKANLVSVSERYGFLFSNHELDVLYPGFYNSSYLPECLKIWIINGIWDRKQLEEYIDHHYRFRQGISPKDQVRNCRIDYLEEEIAKQGLLDILQDAYDGTLSLNEYVFFVINSRLSRYYKLIDLHIDWEQVYSGINKRIESSIQNGEKNELMQETIDILDGFTDEEKAAYQIINRVREESVAMFEVNRREYINEMRNNPEEAFIKISNHRFNCFDQEMADATVEGFKKASIPVKIRFPAYFEGVWNNYRHSFDINQEGIAKTEQSLCFLKEKLSKVEEDYVDLPFKRRYTQVFMDTIDHLLKDGDIEQGSDESI